MEKAFFPVPLVASSVAVHMRANANNQNKMENVYSSKVVCWQRKKMSFYFFLYLFSSRAERRPFETYIEILVDCISTDREKQTIKGKRIHCTVVQYGIYSYRLISVAITDKLWWRRDVAHIHTETSFHPDGIEMNTNYN